MRGRDLVARDRLFSAEVGIYRMEIQAMFAGNQRERPVQVLPQFTQRACLARVVPSGLNAAAAEPAPSCSNPPTSSPCQQWREIGIDSSLFKAASVSTPQEA